MLSLIVSGSMASFVAPGSLPMHVSPNRATVSPVMEAPNRIAAKWAAKELNLSPSAAAVSPAVMETADDLKVLATELNPVVGFWEPLNLAEQEFFGRSNEATIAWLRHAEIKHGRVAMIGVVGFLYHEFGLQSSLSAPDVWDACSSQLKLAVILTVGFLEWKSETTKPHYINGGMVGVPAFPTIQEFCAVKDPAKRRKKKLAEINNGRLAMIGLMGLISASKGCIVPGLDSLPLKPYAGEVMAPFVTSDSGLPLVEQMLAITKDAIF